MARDACSPQLSWATDAGTQTITGVVLTTIGNTCNADIPVTVPGDVVSTHGFTTEQRGSGQCPIRDVFSVLTSCIDPLTIWVTMPGSPVNFTLSTPIPL